MLNLITENGIGLMNFLVDFSYARWLINAVITVEIGEGIYKVIMWILKKIPILNIK